VLEDLYRPETLRGEKITPMTGRVGWLGRRTSPVTMRGRDARKTTEDIDSGVRGWMGRET